MTGPRFTRTPHIVALVAEAERLAAAVAGADADRDTVSALRAEAALASLQLDGSPLTEAPDPSLAEVALREEAGRSATAESPRRGTWLDALGKGEVPDEEVAAVEYLGVLRALTSDDLAERLLTDAESALADLHGRLTAGLVPPALVGRPRVSDQAVHDASIGRVLYFTEEPERIPTRLALLATWLASAGAREHGVVVSGVLHVELLAIHPFESANGRLARTAARLLLRARGLDPLGVAQIEAVLARDPLGYHEEVAKTRRRRDVTIWLERWGEAVTEGLRTAAHRLGVLDADVPERAERFLDGRGEPRFTIVDYRAGAGVGPEDARSDLERLLDAGRVVRVPGARGLRYEVAETNAAMR